MERRPIIIIGSGPAGSASALELQRLNPELAGEVLVLEKAHHPRPKVCAGGLIPHSLDCLRQLDVPLSVPNVLAHRARVDVPGRTVEYEGHELCRVVRRDEFDASLVAVCRARGVEVREDEKVTALVREGDGVRVESERGSYHARVVVGADGSGSMVRRELVPAGRECVGKAIMTDVPQDRIDWSGHRAERYDFSFTAVPAGLRGYVWAFPCLIAGRPHANIGVYSVQAAGSGALLYRLLKEELDRLGASGDWPIKSFPIRWYGRSVRIAAPHVLLAGDAAGVDALMGEGISYALEYGRRAAARAANALATSDFSFAAYERDVADSWLGKKLRRLEMSSRLFYGWSSPLWFAIAAKSPRAQEIGIRWYNGVDGWDRRSGWAALAAWWRGTVKATPAQSSVTSKP
ncbi:MAG: NAD(P)/FAD-dependent oxidoreductase [Deltaproteobacteria bacterium]|nr:NAD(P)/FAD-dependent oxidoreductase [Deltaproteobacteria bacterium]